MDFQFNQRNISKKLYRLEKEFLMLFKVKTKFEEWFAIFLKKEIVIQWLLLLLTNNSFKNLTACQTHNSDLSSLNKFLICGKKFWKKSNLRNLKIVKFQVQLYCKWCKNLCRLSMRVLCRIYNQHGNILPISKLEDPSINSRNR